MKKLEKIEEKHKNWKKKFKEREKDQGAPVLTHSIAFRLR